MRNNYLICYGDDPPRPWQPPETDFSYPRECDFWGKALAVMDELVEDGGRTVIVTWDLRSLPLYGPDVVAVVLGDEWFNYPVYTDLVGAVFKTYGVAPPWRAVSAGLPGLPAQMYTAELARTVLRGFPERVRQYSRRMRPNRPGLVRHNEVHTLPLGYYNQLDLPIRPIEARGIDVMFAGSVYGKQGGIRRFVHGPKEITRGWMLDALDRLSLRRPDLNVHVKVNTGFPIMPPRAEAESYSETLMNTRICLAPRGTNVETHRSFEALRAGCVVIVNSLPRRWFYEGAPVIELRDWRTVDRVVEELLSDEARLRDLHERALRWWRDVCQERLLGEFMADRLNAVSGTPGRHGRGFPLDGDVSGPSCYTSSNAE
jgi:hypothetical protein